MSSGELKKAKKAVRGRVRDAREAMDPASRSEASLKIAHRFLDLPELGSARTVMAFWSFGSEVDTAPLMSALRQRGHTVALPRIVDAELQPQVYEEGDPFTETSFGAKEPSIGRVLGPEDVDIVVTPGVAFDLSGARVGYGGGYYDRFFPLCGGLRAGICFDLQIVQEPLPGGAFDLPVDVILTESRTLRCDRP